MATDRDVRLTPEQALHERVMGAVAVRMQELPFVLKGGTALALLYGLDRHSVDLDFDVGSAKRVSIERQVRDGVQDADVVLRTFKRGRLMWRGRRFEVHYCDPQNGQEQLLKIELSSRTNPSLNDVVTVDRIRTYKIPALFDRKMNAAEGRTKARDLFDLGFLVEHHGDSFSVEQIRRADEFSRDYRGLADRYRPAFGAAPLLRNVATADDRALILRIGVVEQLHHRGMSIVEQAASKSVSLPDILALHRVWLESDGRQGARADLREQKLAAEVLCGVNLERADLRKADFSSADLRSANLRRSDLTGAVLDGADLRGADFSGADLTDISLRSSRVGPTTRGFTDALNRVVKPDQTPQLRYRWNQAGNAQERDFGPSR